MTSEYRLKLLSKVLNENSDSITEDAVLKYLKDHISKCRSWAAAILDNPEASLSELAALHIPPISKSGLNHRLQKLSDESKK